MVRNGIADRYEWTSEGKPKAQASRGDGEPSVIKGNHMSVW